MERNKWIWRDPLLSAVLFQLVMLTTASNVTTNSLQGSTEEAVEGFVWTAWSSWSPCSRSCGGGVSVQERQCIPRSRIPEGPLPRPTITVRITREAPIGDCQGVAKRYHECNTQACPGREKDSTGRDRDSRADQCAEYDRRPFRGRFYTWVPYIDGDAPCMLNCRPLGQHFYASLSLVADGTPCTRPGYRAICVQGVCKAVGRESVLSSASTRELRCGRRLVSGLFSRPTLPLGYSYVTTIPRGACRINVSEIVPVDNYIALKISNGSYIMNGEFAISAPGAYDAVGARFIYSRKGQLDSISALGPIHQPIDIMIVFTRPSANIKYEYFTESGPGEVDTLDESSTNPRVPEVIPSIQPKHPGRHHSYDYVRFGASKRERTSKEVSSEDDNMGDNVIGGRIFGWKIISYTQCSRSCGGGFQVGKFRCVESDAKGINREVSPVHCNGSPPAARRRRCGNVPCAPRWRAAAWSSCPVCGPALRTRVVGCVQDHSKGITKVTDQKCPAPKPPTTEKCNVPDCDEADSGEVKYIEPKKANRPRSDQTDTFREGPVYTVPVNNTELDYGPEYTFTATAGWLYTDWSDCVGWCVGEGVQSRGVRCADPSGCAPRKSPEHFKSCTPKLSCQPHEGQWFTGDWSPCSSNCGGKQVRGVLCIGGTGRHLRDVACKSPKPEQERNCGDECPPTWYFSDWGQCTGNCSTNNGVQRRTVWCAQKDVVSEEADCKGQKPPAQRPCTFKCSSIAIATLPPESPLDPQNTDNITTTQKVSTTTKNEEPKDCEDKLTNCALAVQARLCHYNYYVQNCCHSCASR